MGVNQIQRRNAGEEEEKLYGDAKGRAGNALLAAAEKQRKPHL